MPITRDNHYVPRWYQAGFFEAGRNTLAYLDLEPPRTTLPDGRTIVARSQFDAPTSRCFYQSDLYSTFFGSLVNDEIERRLFGALDSKGAGAVRAFMGTDLAQWHTHFETFFSYVDLQKIRTPKGLAWLKSQYPSLAQNDLMYEMQGIRLIHCTIWTEGVREIVSAQDAKTKFIISDHPVTVYNYAAPPEADLCAYPNDPAIMLKASQTIYPLNRDFCLILTNYEYAKDHAAKPLEKRTFARNFRNSMVRTDAFVRTRRLTSHQVAQINYILKKRARRYIAAGKAEWLHPESVVSSPWHQLRDVLLPPDDELGQFGGELFVKFNDGHVHYQDAFGRTEQEREFLRKVPPAREPRAGDWCGCGSGKKYKDCCKSKPVSLRPTWRERSIRERHLMLLEGISNILDIAEGKDWTRVRKELTDKQISDCYHLYEALWPRETDLLQLLPKPDGCPRAIYTGSLHPMSIQEFAVGAPLYFGELLIQDPFVHPGTVKKEFSPVENPRSYRQEFLKTLFFFVTVMPLVENGLVNLVPDPCNFDDHLRDQMFRMASARSVGNTIDLKQEARLDSLMRQDAMRSMMLMPRDVLRAQMKKALPELDDEQLEVTLQHLERMREDDPLAVLQADTFGPGDKNGQFGIMKLSPNFELSMYLAQATGACIVTDSLFRWNEIRKAVRRNSIGLTSGLPGLGARVARSTFFFPHDVTRIPVLASHNACSAYPAIWGDTFRYLANLAKRGPKPNWEAHVSARFDEIHARSQCVIQSSGLYVSTGKITCAFPPSGIQDNNVNRLLLMSSSERHLQSVPMAFFLEGPKAPPPPSPFLPLAG